MKKQITKNEQVIQEATNKETAIEEALSELTKSLVGKGLNSKGLTIKVCYVESDITINKEVVSNG